MFTEAELNELLNWVNTEIAAQQAAARDYMTDGEIIIVEGDKS